MIKQLALTWVNVFDTLQDKCELQLPQSFDKGFSKYNAKSPNFGFLVLSLALFFYYNCSLTIHADISWEPGVNAPNCVEVVSSTEI